MIEYGLHIFTEGPYLGGDWGFKGYMTSDSDSCSDCATRPATRRIISQAGSCLFKLETSGTWQWTGNSGDMAWRRRISWWFIPGT